MLLEVMSGRGGRREHRLALAAVGRTMLNDDELGERVAEVAERLADGRALPGEVGWARRRVQDWQQVMGSSRWPDHRRARFANALYAAFFNTSWFELSPVMEQREADRRAQCDLIRDVYGRWSQPVLVRDAWLRGSDAAVPKVARAIYEEKRFCDLPVLADALEDAGCDEPALLAHLRAPGPHVRGCWAIDALLAAGVE